jgi:hypothetical protein
MFDGLIRAIYLSQGKAVEIEFQGWAGVFIPMRRFKQTKPQPQPPEPSARPDSIRAQAIAAAYLILSSHPPGTMLCPKAILDAFDLLPDHQPFLPDKKNRLYRLGHELWVESQRRDAQVCHHAGLGYSLPDPVDGARRRRAIPPH